MSLKAETLPDASCGVLTPTTTGKLVFVQLPLPRKYAYGSLGKRCPLAVDVTDASVQGHTGATDLSAMQATVSDGTLDSLLIEHYFDEARPVQIWYFFNLLEELKTVDIVAYQQLAGFGDGRVRLGIVGKQILRSNVNRRVPYFLPRPERANRRRADLHVQRGQYTAILINQGVFILANGGYTHFVGNTVFNGGQVLRIKRPGCTVPELPARKIFEG